MPVIGMQSFAAYPGNGMAVCESVYLSVQQYPFTNVVRIGFVFFAPNTICNKIANGEAVIIKREVDMCEEIQFSSCVWQIKVRIQQFIKVPIIFAG